MFDYLIERFIPWSLKIDTKSVVSGINKEKEKFFCDMFNHFALSFKGLPTYELHMFRVSFNTINMLDSEIISITLPSHNKYHSVYIVHKDNKSNYFLLNKTNSKFELVNMNDKKICGSVDIDLNNLTAEIANYIFSK